MRSLQRDRSGSAAVEFAVIGPILVVSTYVMLEFGLAIWTWNSLQSVAKTAARCVAVSSPLCATVSSDCGSSDAGVCYVLTIAKTHGISDLTASMVTVDSSSTVGNTSLTAVSIAYPIEIQSFGFTIHATASFPNN